MCYSISVHYLFFLLKIFCFLKCVLLGSDSSGSTIKPTVKRSQTASVFTMRLYVL